MGNKVSSDDSYGKIIIMTQKKKYIAGEQVNGWVNVSLLRPFPSNELFLLIEGKEKTKVVDSRTYTNSEGHTRTEYYTRKEKNIFYEHTFPIYRFNSAYVPPGQYSFPFSFNLGEHLPGSFEYYWNSNGYEPYGKIRYKMTAGFKDYNSSSSIYDKFEIIVDQKMQNGGSYLMPKPFEANVSGYCYTSHGNYKLAAVFSNDRYLVGDLAQMSIAVDATRADSDIKNIKCELIMETIVTAQGKTNVHNSVVQSVMLPGLAKGTSRVNENSIPVQLNIMTKGELQATASGTLVKNNFKLRILGEVDGCVCYSDHPQTSLPVWIYNKNFGPQSLPVMNNLIPNWQPQTFNNYVCQMTEGNRMTSDFRNKMMMTQPQEMPAY
jgi:hypothetical protein